jgi:hypothetical protein
VEEIFWTSRGVADVARKVQVPPTCVRANHLYIYKWLYMYTKSLLNKHNNSEKSLWLILVFRLWRTLWLFYCAFYFFFVFFIFSEISNCLSVYQIIIKKPLWKYKKSLEGSFNFFASKSIFIVLLCF